MTKIKKVAIVYRPESEQALSLSRELCAWLSEKKIKCFTHPKQKIGRGNPKYTDKSGVQLVIVLGGDGTYLEAVRMVGKKPVPMVGVNLGSLGFLTVHRAQDVYDVVEMALTGKLEKQQRAM